MSIAEFCWDEYDMQSGLTREQLESVLITARLCAQAVNRAGWPDGLDGQVQFEALVLYCLRVGNPPGRLLTAAVRGQKFGRMGWWSARDKVDAAVRIGLSSRDVRKLRTVGQPDRPAREPDWSGVDEEINAMSDEQALMLMPNQFARDLFARAIENGRLPREVPLLRSAMRRGLAERRPLQAACQR